VITRPRGTVVTVNRQRTIAGLGLAAGLLGGGAAGLVLTAPGFAGASPAPAAQTDETVPEDTTDSDTDSGREARHEQRLREVLQPLVDDGTLTAAQLDAVIARLQEARPDGRGPGGPGGPWHRGHGRGPGGGPLGRAVDAVTEVLGLERDALRDELRSGKTLAEIATEQGIEVQAVIDALVADASSHLDQAVADGRITQEQADERLAEITERVTTLVNEGVVGSFGHHD
jgi:polyhydroxyalkanoate synthesis regulator phasin